jgi:hypothetical protein
MDFIDRIIAWNISGDLPNSVKPRPRARFETADGMAGLKKNDTTARFQEQSIRAYVTPKIPVVDKSQGQNETQSHRNQISLGAAVPLNVLVPLASSSPKEITSHIEKENPRETVNEPLISQPASDPEESHRQFVNIKPSEKLDEGKPIESPDSVKKTIEHLTIVERNREFIRPSLSTLDQEPIPQRMEKPIKVNIAIGSIEVRTPSQHAAVPKQTTTTRQLSPGIKPVRSLDNYLLRRNEQQP